MDVDRLIAGCLDVHLVDVVDVHDVDSRIDPSGTNVFSAAEDSLKRRVTRSDAFLPNPTSFCQASPFVFCDFPRVVKDGRPPKVQESAKLHLLSEK